MVRNHESQTLHYQLLVLKQLMHRGLMISVKLSYLHHPEYPQIVVRASLRPRILSLAHYHKLAGHLGQ